MGKRGTNELEGQSWDEVRCGAVLWENFRWKVERNIAVGVNSKNCPIDVHVASSTASWPFLKLFVLKLVLKWVVHCICAGWWECSLVIAVSDIPIVNTFVVAIHPSIHSTKTSIWKHHVNGVNYIPYWIERGGSGFSPRAGCQVRDRRRKVSIHVINF
jgi:hypothetical protein